LTRRKKSWWISCSRSGFFLRRRVNRFFDIVWLLGWPDLIAVAFNLRRAAFPVAAP
jgi:hypothetical protein